ncbi:MAG: HD domain-containing protein [Methyloligellaceae bacterium]
MSNTEFISDAYALAAQKHRSQVDKAGNPYLYHCHAVAAAVRELGYEYEIIGVLHDIVEDTDCSLDDIHKAFGDVIRAGVDAMTQRDGEDYFSEYLPRLEKNFIAVAVKLADAKHNFSRVSQIDDPERRDKYAEKYSKVIRRLEAVVATSS